MDTMLQIVSEFLAPIVAIIAVVISFIALTVSCKILQNSKVIASQARTTTLLSFALSKGSEINKVCLENRGGLFHPSRTTQFISRTIDFMYLRDRLMLELKDNELKDTVNITFWKSLDTSIREAFSKKEKRPNYMYGHIKAEITKEQYQQIANEFQDIIREHDRIPFDVNNLDV